MIFISPPAVYQVSSFEALRVGKYDGVYDVRNLTRHGDFGLGTYNGLSGEMIVLGGKMYQIDAFGDARMPAKGTKTPFAFVTTFRSAHTLYVSAPMSSAEVQAQIDRRYKSGMIAIRIHGAFEGLVSRSFANQTKPYLPFAKIGDRQSMLPYGKVEGDFVGFRMPATVGTLNVPGYHFHFIASDRKHGGHVLSFAIKSGTIDVMPVSGIVQAKN